MVSEYKGLLFASDVDFAQKLLKYFKTMLRFAFSNKFVIWYRLGVSCSTS